MYTDHELEQVRKTISSRAMAGQEADTEVHPPHLAPFLELMVPFPTLFQKLKEDHLLETYSVYGFFPGVHESIYHEGLRPELSFAGRARGRVAILKSGDGGTVIKPAQSDREGEVATIAGDAGVGPKQYPSLPGYLTEELVQGAFFTELGPEDLDDDSMYRAGGGLGDILVRLHQQQVYYNDTTLSDPTGRSHLVLVPGGGCRLIDFGVSILLDRHPTLARQDVYNFVRTLPTYRLVRGMGMDGEEMDRFLEDYSHQLGRTSPEEIMSQDLRFAEEGLTMAARRMGRHIVEPFTRGFREAYGA